MVNLLASLADPLGLFDEALDPDLTIMDAIMGPVEQEVLDKLGVTNFEDQVAAAMTKFENTLMQDVEEAMMRECPGVLIYAGNNMTIGSGGSNPDTVAPVAVGMFVAGGNLYDRASKTVGCLWSTGGSIQAHTVYYYPYFTRASLPVPKDNRSLSSADIFQVNELFQFDVPGSSDTVDVTANEAHRLVEGYTR